MDCTQNQIAQSSHLHLVLFNKLELLLHDPQRCCLFKRKIPCPNDDFWEFWGGLMRSRWKRHLELVKWFILLTNSSEFHPTSYEPSSYKAQSNRRLVLKLKSPLKMKFRTPPPRPPHPLKVSWMNWTNILFTLPPMMTMMMMMMMKMIILDLAWRFSGRRLFIRYVKRAAWRNRGLWRVFGLVRRFDGRYPFWNKFTWMN